MSRRSKALVALVLSGSAALAGPAQADPFHYRNLLIGDRAVGLGGAFVALADDTSGLFHNPAGVVHSEQLASATVNALSRSETEFAGFFPNGGSLSATSSGLVPSYFGILRHTGFGTLGFSIAVSDFLSERQLDRDSFTLINDLGAPVNVDDFLLGDADYRQYAAGPSWAIPVADRFSVGLTLYGTFRDLREARSIGGSISAPDRMDPAFTLRRAVQTSYRIEDTQFGVRPVLGLAWRDTHAGFGVTVSRDFGLDRQYDYVYRSNAADTRIAADGSITPQTVLDVAGDSSSSEKQDLPWQLSAGLAFEPWHGCWVSAQMDRYFAVDQTVVRGADELSPPVTRRFRAVTNYALGIEFALTERAALRIAGFTDRANLDADRAGNFERAEEIDLVGFSLGGAYRDSVREYKAGIYYSAGNGEATLGDLEELSFSAPGTVDAEGRRLVLFFGAEL
ncbi:MAG: OmpP1/FadL family transporter [Panacagrimonas sp.]